MRTLAEQVGDLRTQYPGLSKAAAAKLIRRYDKGGRAYRDFLRETRWWYTAPLPEVAAGMREAAQRFATAMGRAQDHLLMFGSTLRVPALVGARWAITMGADPTPEWVPPLPPETFIPADLTVEFTVDAESMKRLEDMLRRSLGVSEYLPDPRPEPEREWAPSLSISKEAPDAPSGLTREDFNRALDWLSRPRETPPPAPTDALGGYEVPADIQPAVSRMLDEGIAIKGPAHIIRGELTTVMLALGIPADELQPDGPQSATLAQEAL